MIKKKTTLGENHRILHCGQRESGLTEMTGITGSSGGFKDFSENTLSRNSLSWFGSNVDGMIL